MKAIRILMFALATLLVANAFAQPFDVKFDKGETYRAAWVTPADTINGAESLSKVFKVAVPFKYNFALQMSADTVAADSTCSFTAFGSVDGYTYKPIDTVVWYMTADTTVLLEGSAVGWRFIKGTLTAKGTGARILLGKSHLQISQ